MNYYIDKLYLFLILKTPIKNHYIKNFNPSASNQSYHADRIKLQMYLIKILVLGILIINTSKSLTSKI